MIIRYLDPWGKVKLHVMILGSGSLYHAEVCAMSYAACGSIRGQHTLHLHDRIGCQHSREYCLILNPWICFA